MIRNPRKKAYVDRVNTTVRLNAEVRKALDRYVEAQGLTIAEVVSDVVEAFLKEKGYLK